MTEFLNTLGLALAWVGRSEDGTALRSASWPWAPGNAISPPLSWSVARTSAPPKKEWHHEMSIDYPTDSSVLLAIYSIKPLYQDHEHA